MANCFVLYRPRKRPIPPAAAARHKKVLQVVKEDGKILEYRAPMLVKDMLIKFPGYGFALSPEALQPLPPSYQLKAGHVYHLLPLYDPVQIASPAHNSPSVDLDSANGTKRIKVIITKHQLQELLLQKVSVEEMLSGLQKDAWDGVHSSVKRWRPLLETIPEGSEYWIASCHVRNRCLLSVKG